MRTPIVVTAILLSMTAQAATQTYVSLAGRDDGLPRLGRPGIAVQVEAVTQADAILVTNELQRELARLVHTRPLAADEAGDYDLLVRLEASDTASTIPFTATLTSADGERLWRIDGRTETTDAVFDPPVFLSVGRNVVSAMIHDGWLQPRYDPNDPPPSPPKIRNDDSAR